MKLLNIYVNIYRGYKREAKLFSVYGTRFVFGIFFFTIISRLSSYFLEETYKCSI